MDAPLSKTKVYHGIACVEMQSPEGHLWWYQPGNLAYTPVRIAGIRKIVRGVVGARTVYAIPMEDGVRQVLVALNMPRCDVHTLVARGLLPADYPLPAAAPTYTPWPAYAKADPSQIL